MKAVQPNILLFALLFLFFAPCAMAQQPKSGLKGYVKAGADTPLPFASIYIRNTGQGFTTNQLGYFEIPLPEGVYDVVVQFMGYGTQVQTLTVTAQQWIEKDILLEEQTFALQEVEVKSGKEDPALTIMRKAIAKADFHRLQIKRYTKYVYLKGTGVLENAPFFIKKQLKEEGLNLNEAYTLESVSRITFTQPNKYDEEVLSIRTSGDDFGASPAPYLNTSFYEQEVAGGISPLARQAFAYYRFTLLGSFFEGNRLIHKIKITPRSRGEGVFEGTIHIIDELWAIHSIDVFVSQLGFKIEQKELFIEVQEDIWLPGQLELRFSGKILGFGGSFTYLSSSDRYTLELDETLAIQPKLIDEKITSLDKASRQKSTLERLEEGEEVSRKELRRLMQDFEKEAIKEAEVEQITEVKSYKVDSLARKRNLSYWDSIRPVALTEAELKGYTRDDSLAQIQKEELTGKREPKDSTAQNTKSKWRFRPGILLSGTQKNLGGGQRLIVEDAWGKINFNTVEGVTVGSGMRYEKTRRFADTVDTRLRRKEFVAAGYLRYGFSSELFLPRFALSWTRDYRDRSSLVYGLGGGSRMQQFNSEGVIGNGPILEQVNSLYTLLLRQNLMKIYAEDYLEAQVERKFSDALSLNAHLLYSQRRFLENSNNFSLYNRPERVFTSNFPENVETRNAEEAVDHEALIAAVDLTYRFGIRYSISNGRKSLEKQVGPTLKLHYSRAFGELFDSPTAAQFDFISGRIEHEKRFGISGRLHVAAEVGKFLTNEQVYLMDFAHFGGNRTLFASLGVVDNFRFMDYYLYSTRDQYAKILTNYQFRKFALTQLPYLRTSGLRENLFVNFLVTPTAPRYTEIGYAVDNIFRIFRVEAGMAFENDTMLRSGLRFGVASIFRFQ